MTRGLEADRREHGDVPRTPRTLSWITVKRDVPLTGRSYGHWWIEIDGVESYGWWPTRPASLFDLVRGVPGVLNGVGARDDGSASRDPNHGLPADFEFHPVLVVPRDDDEVREAIGTFAKSFEGEWRWSTTVTMNCRMFQLALFDAVGLVDGTGNYHTRGSGCPALAPVRRAVARVTGRRRWPRNLTPPGGRVALTASPRDRPGVGRPERAGFTRRST